MFTQPSKTFKCLLASATASGAVVRYTAKAVNSPPKNITSVARNTHMPSREASLCCSTSSNWYREDRLIFRAGRIVSRVCKSRHLSPCLRLLPENRHRGPASRRGPRRSCAPAAVNRSATRAPSRSTGSGPRSAACAAITTDKPAART